MQTVLIAGGASFIGANFIPYFLIEKTEYKAVNVDLLSCAGGLPNLSVIQDNARFIFIQSYICDK
jgi:dTDP-glucose 4,6-dehydratase